jgi:hypothetical protein
MIGVSLSWTRVIADSHRLPEYGTSDRWNPI